MFENNLVCNGVPKTIVVCEKKYFDHVLKIYPITLQYTKLQSPGNTEIKLRTFCL